MLGSLSDTAMSSMRPPMLAGPIERKRKLDSSGLVDALIIASRWPAPPPCPWVATSATRSGMAIRGSATRAIPRSPVCITIILFESSVRAPGSDKARSLPPGQRDVKIRPAGRATFYNAVMLTIRRRVATLAFLVAACCAAAQRPPGAGSDAIRIPFDTYALPNGLTVILSADRTTPTVAVEAWFHVGSKNELPGRTGFAHLFEHVMFTGSGHVPYGLHDKLTEGVGGSNNGTTSNDRTVYFETVPSNYLESALWLESDRMGYLLDTLDLTKLNAQRDIVKNERRQGMDNQPYGRADEILSHATYPASHPYSWDVIGSMEDLSAASEDDVKNFFRLYYAPNNAYLTVVGDFDLTQARGWISKYFGDIPRGQPITRPAVAPVTLDAEARLVYEDRVQGPR